MPILENLFKKENHPQNLVPQKFPIYGIVDMHGNIGGDFDVLQQIHGTSIGSLYSIAHVTPKHFIQITK